VSELLTSAVPPVSAPYKNRSGGLVAFGVLELLFALGCLLLLALLVVGTRLQPTGMPPGYSPPNLTVASLFYLFLAVAFGWLGVGSILARRWACALSLACAWLWLVLGTVAGVFLFLALPRIFATLPEMPTSGARAAAMGCVAIVWVIFFLILPLAFVLFYGSRNVRRTCEARDTRPRWTDRCPLPVLALVVLSAVAVPLLALSSLHPIIAAFGWILTGPPAAVAFLVLAALEAVAAWGLYRLRPAAWWGLLALWLLGGISSLLTFHRGIDWEKYLRASGQPDNPMVRQMTTGLFQDPLFIGAMTLVGVACLGYMLWIRRYFVPRPT